MTVLGPPPKPDPRSGPPSRSAFPVREILWSTVIAASAFLLYWGLGWRFHWPD